MEATLLQHRKSLILGCTLCKVGGSRTTLLCKQKALNQEFLLSVTSWTILQFCGLRTACHTLFSATNPSRSSVNCSRAAVISRMDVLVLLIVEDSSAACSPVNTRDVMVQKPRLALARGMARSGQTMRRGLMKSTGAPLAAVMMVAQVVQVVARKAARPDPALHTKCTMTRSRTTYKVTASIKGIVPHFPNLKDHMWYSTKAVGSLDCK